MADFIGQRGEAISVKLLMQDCAGRDQPYFHPIFLGEKARAVDYLVELVDAGERTLYFFVQVKSTSLGYTRRENRLRVQVGARNLQSLQGYIGPTYVIGIDERNEVGYIISANEDVPERISSLSTRHQLNCQTLELLWQEVKQYWDERDMILHGSRFSE